MFALATLALLSASRKQDTPPVKTDAPKKGTILLRVKAEVGESYRYESVMNMVDVGGEDSLTIKSTILETLKRVYEEQQDWEVVTNFREVTTSPRFAEPARALQAINGLPVTIVRNDRARVLKMVVGDQELASRGTSNVCFPKSEVNVGDYWNAPVEAGGKVYQIRYILRELFNDRGRATAKIEGWYLPDQAAQTVKPIIFWVDLETGRTVHSEGVTRLSSGSLTFELSQTLDLKEVKHSGS